MVADIDIYRPANILIDQHGETAYIAAAQRIDELDEKGDLDGLAVRRRIMRAEKELQNLEPDGLVN